MLKHKLVLVVFATAPANLGHDRLSHVVMVVLVLLLQEDPAASAAIAATMEQLDFNKLLQQVDSGYRSWRKPSLLLFGANDPFVDVKNPFAFLDDKRTNMRLVTASAKVGPTHSTPNARALHCSCRSAGPGLVFGLLVLQSWCHGATHIFHLI